MKVILLNPPWTTNKGYGLRSNSRWPHISYDKKLTFPIYLAYAAALLEKNNINVDVIDAVPEELTKEDLVNIFEKDKIDYLFMETSTPTIQEDLCTANFLKENVKYSFSLFLLGPHVSVFPMEILTANKYIDGIIIGEFENTILEIVKGKEYSSIDGLAFRKGNEIKVNPKTKYIENLDELPFPAWHKFKLEYYEDHLYYSPSMIMIPSRGCPFHCTFCLWPNTMYGHKQRLRTPQNICDEIEILIERYNIREIRFDDDTFALNKNWVISICEEIIKRKLNKKIIWSCFGHFAQDDEEMYKYMAYAGCEMICFGLETASEHLLRYIKKGINLNKVKKVIDTCKKYHIKTFVDFMIGFPYETKEDIEKSIEFAKIINPDFIQVSKVVIYPGTEMYNEGKQKKFLIYPEEWDKYNSEHLLIKNPNISEDELHSLYLKFWRRYYLRKDIILKNIIEIFKNPKEFKRKVKGIISFIKRFIL